MKSVEIKAPSFAVPITSDPKIFLAGSIEMGTAENWQEKIVKAFPWNVVFLNPRRDNWDSSWKQDLNNPMFYEQVTWELEMLEESDHIVMYFDPNTKSPISLLELGLWAKSGKLIVCCPDGFWRKGNVDILCQAYKIPLFTNIETLIVALKLIIKNHKN